MNIQKKLINLPQTCVEDAIQGVLLTEAGLKRVEGLNILVRAAVDQLKSKAVSIISGMFFTFSIFIHHSSSPVDALANFGQAVALDMNRHMRDSLGRVC